MAEKAYTMKSIENRRCFIGYELNCESIKLPEDLCIQTYFYKIEIMLAADFKSLVIVGLVENKQQNEIKQLESLNK